MLIKNLKLSFILFLLLVVFLSGCAKKEPQSVGSGAKEQKQEKQSSEETKSFTGSLMDALKLGKSLKCQWKKDANNFGTAWIKGKNYKSENTIDGKKGFIIHKDGCTYIWTNEENKGMKMCQEENQAETEANKENIADQKEAGDQAKAWQKNYNYHCLPAILSDGQFNPPANITFSDPFAAMPSMPSMPNMPNN